MTAQTIEELAAANGWEVIDLEFDDPTPRRTATACNALGCQCTEWADGPIIGGYPSCHVCTHTKASHTPPNPTKKKAIS